MQQRGLIFCTSYWVLYQYSPVHAWIIPTIVSWYTCCIALYRNCYTITL